jgi:hypothetical protein
MSGVTLRITTVEPLEGHNPNMLHDNYQAAAPATAQAEA